MTNPEAEAGPGPTWVLGCILGLAGGPAAGYGAMWSGIHDPSWWTAPIVTAVGVIIGGATWRLFQQPCQRPGVAFAALFAGTVGLVAGATAAFPMGGICGAAGGAGGGALATATWRTMQSSRLPLRALMAGGSGAVCGWLVALGVVS